MSRTFTEKQIKAAVHYHYEDIENYSPWRRKLGATRVDFHITFGDANAIAKLIGLPELAGDDFENIQKRMRQYIIDNDLVKEEFYIGLIKTVVGAGDKRHALKRQIKDLEDKLQKKKVALERLQ